MTNLPVPRVEIRPIAWGNAFAIDRVEFDDVIFQCFADYITEAEEKAISLAKRHNFPVFDTNGKCVWRPE